MEINVLGTASIGGVPEWDCACANCAAARADPSLRRTRSSLTVTCDGDRHILVDAGHDLKQQLEASGLTPLRRGQRESRIDSVVLTHGHADHTVGLAEFCTGKSFSLPVYAPPDLIDFLFGSPDRPGYFSELGRLAKDYVVPVGLPPGEAVTLLGEVEVEGFEVPHTRVLEGGRRYPSTTYGYEFRHRGERFVYAPDIAGFDADFLARVGGADLVMVDACFWWDDELRRVSGIPATSRQLGHMPLEEAVGALKGAGAGRVVFTHFNHTNPVLDSSQPYRGVVEGAGMELAFDGMRITL
jgi:pyrroloquinoline quinone biosynthesis protein B